VVQGLVGDGGDRFFDALDAPRVEGGRDDAAQPRVAGLSVEIIPAKYSTISVGRSMMLTAPWPER